MSVCNCGTCAGNELKEKQVRIAREKSILLSAMALWVRNSHHQDGCIRRHYPYPKRTQKIPCNCGKEKLVEVYERLDGVTVVGNNRRAK